jgi:hypothetical protein
VSITFTPEGGSPVMRTYTVAPNIDDGTAPVA